MWQARATAWLVIGRRSAEFAAAGATPDPQRPRWAATFDANGAGAPEAPTQAAMLQAVDRLMLDAQGPDADQLRGRRLAVVVAGPWVPTAVLPWNDALLHEAAAQAYASRQLREAGFNVSQGDRILVEDTPYRSTRLAVACPSALLAKLDEMASRAGMTVHSVVTLPMVAAAWARRRTGRSSGVLAVVAESAVTFLRWTGGSWAPLGDPAPLAQADTATAALIRAWQRIRLRDASLSQSGTVLSVLDLADAPGAALPAAANGWQALALPERETGAGTPLMRLAQDSTWRAGSLDAAPRRVAVAGMAAWVAVAAVLVAAVAVYKAAHVAAEVHAAESAWVTSNPVAPASRRTPPSREVLARMAAVNGAITALNMPISDLLRVLQPPQGLRVGLLTLEIQPPKAGQEPTVMGGLVKLSGEAASATDMTGYVSYVASRRPFTEAYLTSHEVQESEPVRTFRFSAEAVWLP